MLEARRIVEELRRNRVTHVIGLPDNWSAKLFESLAAGSDIRLVAVTREGEAFAIAAGLWIGGRTPAVLVQNTGFFESGDSVRGTVMRMRVPLVVLITFRGFGRAVELQPTHGTGPIDADTMSCAQLDSAALITEPTLRAWGVPYLYLRTDADATRISDAFLQAGEHQQPCAVLVTAEIK
jgi:sulfopyruvate decarboxylase TPP-binding subunit